MKKTTLFLITFVASILVCGAALQPIGNSHQEREQQARAPRKCFIIASELGLDSHQSILLCSNAKGDEPIRCFKTIVESLTVDQKINLCQGANCRAPAECMDESLGLGLTFDQRIRLCSSANYTVDDLSILHHSSTGPVHCFQESAKLPLTPDQRVILCGGTDSIEPIQCFNFSNDLPLTLDQRVRLCTHLNPMS